MKAHWTITSAHRHTGISAYRQRRSIRYVVVFLALLSSVMLHAQRRPKLRNEDPDGPVRWLIVEKSVGVVPEIDFVNGAMGINLCRGKFIRGTHNGMAGNGYYAGLSYDTDHQVTSAAFGAWIGLFRRKAGGQVALKGLYYFGKQTQVLAVRPEAGFGFPKAQLSYGYTFYTEKTELQLPTHSLTLYVYFAFFSNRVSMF